MYKLVILIEIPDDDPLFENQWPNFLRFAEKMPGLVKEATSRIGNKVFGEYECSMIHELYFESRGDLEKAMSSYDGKVAGSILQRITRGKMTLLFADHQEDTAENLKSHAQPPQDGPSGEQPDQP
jgi:hypothetical protein